MNITKCDICGRLIENGPYRHITVKEKKADISCGCVRIQTNYDPEAEMDYDVCMWCLPLIRRAFLAKPEEGK